MGAVALTEVVVAACVVEPRLVKVLAALAGVAAFAAVLRWPVLGVVALLGLVASALDPELIIVNLGPLHARGYELALGALFVVAALAPRRRTWGGAVGGFAAAFLGLLVVCTWVAIRSGSVSLSDAVQWGRGFAALLFFFCVIRLFPDRRSLDRLLTIGAVLAALTGLVSAAVAAGVNLDPLFGSSATQFVDTSQGLGSIPRIRLPGVGLAYVLLWWAVLQGLRAHGARRLAWVAILTGMVACLGLSLNRDMWLGAVGGLFLLVPLGGASLRRSMGIGASLAACTVAVMLLLGVGVSPSSPLEPIIARGQTLLSPAAVGQEDSLQSRGRETTKAWGVVRAHPLLGIGPGTPFGVTYYAPAPNGHYEPNPQLFLHNQYLYLLLIGGVPTLLAFLAFLGGVLGRARRLMADRGAVASAVGLIMLLVSAFVLIAFQDANMMATLALVAGTLVARGALREGHDVRGRVG